jgi:hypothetical protein
MKLISLAKVKYAPIIALCRAAGIPCDPDYALTAVNAWTRKYHEWPDEVMLDEATERYYSDMAEMARQ